MRRLSHHDLILTIHAYKAILLCCRLTGLRNEFGASKSRLHCFIKCYQYIIHWMLKTKDVKRNETDSYAKLVKRVES